MAAQLEILRAGPLANVQDWGRPGYLTSGVSASGPMARSAFAAAGDALASPGNSGLEFTMAGLEFRVASGKIEAGSAGGNFNLGINKTPNEWGKPVSLKAGDVVSIMPGTAGNYGYLRFDHEIDVKKALGSRATNLTVGLGGFNGRALQPGDILQLSDPEPPQNPPHVATTSELPTQTPIRFIWGIHAEKFDTAVRKLFTEATFKISSSLDRMGVRLRDEAGVFKHAQILSLVSDAIVPGDIQILGDGTPIVLMRDHQPTGGYPRIGTIISADMDRFAQIRTNQTVTFTPVTVATAQQILRKGTGE